MKEIKYVQPTKHPQYLYIRAQTKTICIIQTHTQGPFYPPYKIRGWGQQARQCMFHLPSPPHNHSMFIFRHRPNNLYSSNKYTRSNILSKQNSGVGENSIPRGYRHGKPLGNPLEALRNTTGTPMGILLESLYPMGHQKSPIGNPISTPWVFPWKAHRNPSVSSHTDPLGTHWYPRKPMGIPKVFHGSIAPFEYPTGIL